MSAPVPHVLLARPLPSAHQPSALGAAFSSLRTASSVPFFHRTRSASSSHREPEPRVETRGAVHSSGIALPPQRRLRKVAAMDSAYLKDVLAAVVDLCNERDLLAETPFDFPPPDIVPSDPLHSDDGNAFIYRSEAELTGVLKLIYGSRIASFCRRLLGKPVLFAQPTSGDAVHALEICPVEVPVPHITLKVKLETVLDKDGFAVFVSTIEDADRLTWVWPESGPSLQLLVLCLQSLTSNICRKCLDAERESQGDRGMGSLQSRISSARGRLVEVERKARRHTPAGAHSYLVSCTIPRSRDFRRNRIPMYGSDRSTSSSSSRRLPPSRSLRRIKSTVC